MTVIELRVGGLRGFASSSAVRLGQPDGGTGSGITVLVGPNNSGKSTIIEAFSALTRAGGSPSFHNGARNTVFGDRVEIQIEQSDGAVSGLA